MATPTSAIARAGAPLNLSPTISTRPLPFPQRKEDKRNVNADANVNSSGHATSKPSTVTATTARDILSHAFCEAETKPPLTDRHVRSQNSPQTKQPKAEPSDVEPSNFGSKFMWGNCSVGPVLSSQLIKMSMPHPTAVQEAAYAVLASKSKSSNKHENVVIASPTGMGKTLAFLLPLLSTTQRVRLKLIEPLTKTNMDSRTSHASILIVTPTVDLAVQIQTVVDQLWPPANDGDHTSSLYLVQKEDTEFPDTDFRPMRRAQLIADTPKTLRNFIYKCRAKKQLSIFSNVKTIVLDEADRLLNTEDAARLYQAKIDLKQQEKLGKPAVKKKKKPKSKSTASKISATQSLLQELEVCQITVDYHAERRYQSKERVQIICASATVGDYH